MAERDWKNVVRWIVTGIVALMLFFAGLQKFIDDGTWEADFLRWGYPAGFSYVVGVIEMAAAVAMVIPKTSSYGAAVLSGNMLAATVTRALDGAWQNVPIDVILTLITAYIAYYRRPVWTERWLPRNR